MTCKKKATHSLNVFLAVVLLAFTGLAFVVPNNFDTDFEEKAKPIQLQKIINSPNSKNEESDTISRKELNQFIYDQLVDPVKKCFEENDPHIFMTKCYSRLFFELSPENVDRKLYRYTTIRGSLILIDCSERTRICDFRVNYEDKKITIRESFRSGSQNLDDYLKDICKFIKKNGVPFGN